MDDVLKQKYREKIDEYIKAGQRSFTIYDVCDIGDWEGIVPPCSIEHDFLDLLENAAKKHDLTVVETRTSYPIGYSLG